MKSFLGKLILFGLVCCLLFGAVACKKANGSGDNNGIVPSGDSSPEIGGKDPVGRSDYSIGGLVPGGKSWMGGEASAIADAYLGEGGSSAGVDESNSLPQIPAGQMTVSAWDDNANYDFWKGLFEKGQTEEDSGKFITYAGNNKLPSLNRLEVQVMQGEQPVANAKVLSKDADGNVTFSAITNANGIAYLFPSSSAGSILAASGSFEATVPMPEDGAKAVINLDGSEEKRDLIEIMFVVDVTGSMGDEINYLKAELGDVIRQVAESNAAAHIRLSFLFYRDSEDEEEFVFVDFRDVTQSQDYEKQQKELAKQRAEGGGDYPEALDEAMEIAVSKQWSQNATKLIFLVLDAPTHSGEPYESRYAKAIKDAASLGIRVCPVLASGADQFCEFLTRSAAILTGGTSIFVTNHSGIGGDHLDPELPEMVVEYLNDCLVRLINGYHTGVFADPVPWVEKTEQTNQQ